MANPFAEMGGNVIGTVFSSIIWFGLGFIIVCILGGTMWYLLIYKKKFSIIVKVNSERAGDPAIYFDKAAILATWKDKRKYFRLASTKVDLPVPQFNILQKTDKGDYLEIWRKSEDEFIYLTPSKIDKTTIVRADGRLYPIASPDQKQIEGDTDWYLSRKEKIKKLVDTESLLMKILPWMPQIIGGTLMIFVLWILMDKLPAVLSALIDLTQELRSLKGAEVTTYDFIWPIVNSLF